VIGVEFSAELHVVAGENIRRYQSPKRRCAAVSSVCADAAFWEPPTENTVFFLYNPFGEDVMRRVLDNLRVSLERNDRNIYMVYCNAVLAPMLDQADFLDRIELPIHAAVYEHKARAAV
jgi:hypothetical protein